MLHSPFFYIFLRIRDNTDNLILVNVIYYAWCEFVLNARLVNWLYKLMVYHSVSFESKDKFPIQSLLYRMITDLHIVCPFITQFLYMLCALEKDFENVWFTTFSKFWFWNIIVFKTYVHILRVWISFGIEYNLYFRVATQWYHRGFCSEFE